jgi:hypothetical protein
MLVSSGWVDGLAAKDKGAFGVGEARARGPAGCINVRRFQKQRRRLFA